MDKKYQIFISSTYEDLKSERDQVIKAILELGHIPVGMEMFSAGDEQQWELIKRQIEQSDYYILIIAHRYGSETPENISYTEKEYDFAKKSGIPTLSFIIKEDALWPATSIDKSAKKKKLDKFKTKAMDKLVQFWHNKDDLYAKVSVSLVKTINLKPRQGWVRSSEAVSADVTKELSRLSNENALLRNELEGMRRIASEHSDAVADVVKIMNSNKRKIKVRSTAKWEDGEIFQTTLLIIFLSIAPNLINENASGEISKKIAFSYYGTGYYKNWPVASNIITALIADWVALDIVEPSKKKHSVNDDNEYWTLTEVGKQVLKRAHRIRLEEGMIRDNETDKASTS
ncbi:DUF4062 domain-containing protein [Erwinia psidii]|uniref:DUF4062 domain-containing protein n=1 Tax=Erwinia psidii TaxID=69224 RepID=A0A3N6V4L4_9GAMM|nr:DUF4062 domain-containing protein [Erwinia psidii]MCX8956750.1 DUF4062 domain-containing protein [Erwinia psidii]MCX8960440.1 DUF4062 domain-containing protein [Erwinia psidii]MCX8964378.1 DUF4062 domain-containing protein [Erwinia psidii]RQM40075.1 DUF4062 domain-containing protein [Erwinia psidii]